MARGTLKSGKAVVPSSLGGKGVGGFRHTGHHDDPHGLQCGMSPPELEALESRFVALATLIFFLAAVSCFVKFVSELQKDEPHHTELYVATTLISTFAFLAYLAKYTGQGYITLPNGTTVCHVRYMDWILTTPLLLFDLCDLSGALPATIIFLIAMDVLMISLGLCAMISREWKHRVLWYFLASVFYCFLLFGILSPLSSKVEEQETAMQDLFSSLKWIIIISWSLYPLVVMLGPSGIAVSADGTVGYFGHSAEGIMIVVLDVISKVGFEALIIFSSI
jgi:bacteriorhodopsin